MTNYNDLKPGTVFILDGQPYQVVEFSFLRMQQRKPVAQTKIKNPSIIRQAHDGELGRTINSGQVNPEKLRFCIIYDTIKM